MKLLVKNRAEFIQSIDSNHTPDSSIVLRYRNAFGWGETDQEDSEFKKWLEKTSIREGARIFPLLTYRGVHLSILDETSCMYTKTLKSIDGCVSIAKSKLNKYEKVLFESGGNTGTALTRYGIRAGLETFMLIPEENLSLLNSRIFDSPNAHLFSVEKPALVKPAARLLGSQNGLRHIPEKNWRYEASMFRGTFLLESLLKGERFDWFTQTISAAFGPIGIYRILGEFGKETECLPRFLGIQQEANAPMFRAWKKKETETPPNGTDSTANLLTRVMYDSHPQTYDTFRDLEKLLTTTGGKLTTVNHKEFNDFLNTPFYGKNILERLHEHGIEITVKGGEVIEKTGLISLAGTLKEIDCGKITRGNRVLCALTSGISEADGKAKPESRISTLDDLTQTLQRIE